jgi:hypothetical protein
MLVQWLQLVIDHLSIPESDSPPKATGTGMSFVRYCHCSGLCRRRGGALGPRKARHGCNRESGYVVDCVEIMCARSCTHVERLAQRWYA